MMKKKIILTIFLAIALAGLTACNKLDVIGDQSIKSFDAMLNKAADRVKEDTAAGGWSLEAPDRAVRFVWSRDFSKTTTYDAYLELDAQPFIDAGLDTSKLPDGMLAGDKLILGTDFGSDALTYNGEVTPLASYKKMVELYRNNITYHTALDHYGVDLMNGNMLEWAKDMTTNDKDLVFVLNPEVFINAGVDPKSVEGWVFAKVPTMDEKGNDIEVDKLLKPFDLDGKTKK
jgi:predicted small secreted protein